MATASPGHSITMRVSAPTTLSATAELTAVITEANGVITGLDVAESHVDRIVIDMTCNTSGTDHVEQLLAAVNALPGFNVEKTSDRTFLMHLGGKLEVRSKVNLRHRDDLSRAYTPGVARVCLAIAENPEDTRRLTIKRNTVAVVTDGSAVLGLGNLGPAAALPVMEGKAALFKRFGNVDAWPVCLDTQDSDEIVAIVKAIAPVYGGINLEDIAAPRCFDIENRLRAALDIPVFHDDQHGTAIVVLAGLINALRVAGKKLSEVSIVISGAGAAGHAIIRLLLSEGATNIVAFDREGAVHAGRTCLDPYKQWIADHTNQRHYVGALTGSLAGADVFIGVSAPNVLTGADIATMNDRSVVLALANPDPEVDPVAAGKHALVVGTGRSDFPNQINNVLVFPGFFRGLLDAGAHQITDAMMVAAACAIADVVGSDELNPSYIIPSVFDEAVASAVAEAVKHAAAAPSNEVGN